MAQPGPAGAGHQATPGRTASTFSETRTRTDDMASYQKSTDRITGADYRRAAEGLHEARDARFQAGETPGSDAAADALIEALRPVVANRQMNPAARTFLRRRRAGASVTEILEAIERAGSIGAWQGDSPTSDASEPTGSPEPRNRKGARVERWHKEETETLRRYTEEERRDYLRRLLRV
jgi:hypothetical protein